MGNRSNTPPRQVIIPIGPSIAYVPLTRGLYALIDSQDAESMGESNWYAMVSCAGYCYASRWQGKKRIGMHQAIAKVQPGYVPDHKNQNTLDNRRSNLREATHLQNVRNTRLARHNTAGFKGVSQTGSGKWRARIAFNGAIKGLGSYVTREEAHAAYCAAATIYFGEFARTA